MARITIPFSSGVREEVDPRAMPEGALKRVENLRLTREGRLALRYGYTALSLGTSVVGTTNTTFVPYDLMSYNGRLLALGGRSADLVPIDVYEYSSGNLRAWRPTDPEGDIRLCPVTGVRNVGRGPAQSASVTVCDVGARGGLVCLAWQLGADTYVHIFDPTTDTTVLQTKLTGMSAPRVVGGNPGLYVFGIVAATVQIWRFDRTVDTAAMTQLTDAFATGAAISAMDASLSEDGTLACVIARNATPAITIKRFSAAGAETQSITGPAVAASFISICGQAARMHLVVCATSDNHVDLYTYLVSGGTLENTTLDLGTAAIAGRQPGICIGGTLSYVLVTFENSAGTIVYMVRLAQSTHVETGLTKQWNRVHLATKPVTSPPSEIFGGTFEENATTSTNFLGEGRGLVTKFGEILGAATDKGLAALTATTALPHIAKDSSTGKFYWSKLVVDGDGRSIPVVSEVLLNDTGRRQSAAIDNALYIAAGVPQIFAGRQVVEAGYLNRPVIVSATPSNSTGTLTSSALYAVCATFEWYDELGRFHTSEPSDVTEVTMGASDDTITSVVTGPLSGRCNSTNLAYGGTCKVVLWRSLAAPDKQLLRDVTSTITPGSFGGTVSIVSTQPDSSLEDEAAIYTQASSGARSGPNAFLSPQPCKFFAASGDKITSGGLPQSSQIRESRAAFPNEPITWAENLGGYASAPERVLAVARLDERRIAFTANGIVEFGGEGLDINGVGDLGTPRRLPSPGGLYGGDTGWRSMVETAIGVFFQLAADSIYLLPRGGGAPVFVGKAVQDTLAAFPVITSATYVKNEQLVCFTCNNSGASDAVILVYDLSTEQWFVDTDTTALIASCEYQGRLVILRANNTIEIEDTSYPAGAFITPLIETGTLYPFGKGGQGQIDEIQLFAEFRAACNVICSLSFDDGATYTALTTKALTGLTVGSAVTLKWGPNVMRGDRVRLKWHCTDLSGASECLAFHFATVDFTASDRSALRNTTQKG